jgi:hypothetical protein
MSEPTRRTALRRWSFLFDNEFLATLSVEASKNFAANIFQEYWKRWTLITSSDGSNNLVPKSRSRTVDHDQAQRLPVGERHGDATVIKEGAQAGAVLRIPNLDRVVFAGGGQ